MNIMELGLMHLKLMNCRLFEISFNMHVMLRHFIHDSFPLIVVSVMIIMLVRVVLFLQMVLPQAIVEIGLANSLPIVKISVISSALFTLVRSFIHHF